MIAKPDFVLVGGPSMPQQQNMPTPQQLAPYMPQSRESCPKYNWTKMDPFEKVGVNVMEAVGSKNAVIGGAFGLFVFAISLVFFRDRLGRAFSTLGRKMEK